MSYSIIIIILVFFIMLNPIFTLVRHNKINKLLADKKLADNNQANLTNGNKSINKSILFGYEQSTNQAIWVGDEELNQHALVIGTTGSGKTTTLMNIVDSCCSKGLPLIYVDGKGGVKLANTINTICNKYNRKLKIFSLDPNSSIPCLSAYNPFAFGNYTEWKNKIITLTKEADTKGQEHYSLQEQAYISLVCEILNKAELYQFHQITKHIIWYNLP